MASGLRSPACFLSCITACFSYTALVTFVTFFATSVLVDTSVHQLALAAAILDILILAALLIFVLFYTFKTRIALSRLHQQRWTFAPIFMLPFMVAMILSIYVLAWMKINMSKLNVKNMESLVAAAIALWAISLLSLAVYFVLCLRRSSSLPDSIISTSDPLRSYIDEAKHKTHSLSMHTLTPSPKRPRSTLSETPSLSLYSSSPISSVRNSLNQLRRSPNSKLSANPDTLAEPRPSDGFETWEVTDHNELAFSLAHLRANQRLETIPGSRPVSPAYPLDGPFPEEDGDIMMPESAYAPRSPSIASSTRFPAFAPSMSRRPSNQDQSHIHPLFRSDSPIPPPTASPGTIFTASPFAGQVVDIDYAFPSRSRKGSAMSSRPSSPGLSIARPGSSNSRPTSLRNFSGQSQNGSRPRLAMSPSLGDLRAELARSPPIVLHKRERSA